MIGARRMSRFPTEAMEMLVQEDYAALERLTHGARLRAPKIEAAVREYGRTLVAPPSEAFSCADVIPIQGTSPPSYSVRFRLYTREEGVSDLELQATLIGDSNLELMNVELDNILVA
jgi:hypothetical protein